MQQIVRANLINQNSKGRTRAEKHGRINNEQLREPFEARVWTSASSPGSLTSESAGYGL